MEFGVDYDDNFYYATGYQNKWGTGNVISSDCIVDVSDYGLVPGDVKKIYDGVYGVFMYCVDQSNVATVYCGGQGRNGINTSYVKLAKLEFSGLQTGEYIVDISAGNRIAWALTNKGNLYGWGYTEYLGNNEKTVANYDTPVKVYEGGDVMMISSGYGYAGITSCNSVMIKKDGTVFGTGNNSLGTLGRYRGENRQMINSRYRTSFTWKECPELEN